MKDSNHEYLQGVLNRIALENPPPDDMTAEGFRVMIPWVIERLDVLVAEDLRSGRAPLDIAPDLAELIAALDETKAMVTGAVAEQLDASGTVVLKRATPGVH